MRRPGSSRPAGASPGSGSTRSPWGARRYSTSAPRRRGPSAMTLRPPCSPPPVGGSLRRGRRSCSWRNCSGRPTRPAACGPLRGLAPTADSPSGCVRASQRSGWPASQRTTCAAGLDSVTPTKDTTSHLCSRPTPRSSRPPDSPTPQTWRHSRSRRRLPAGCPPSGGGSSCPLKPSSRRSSAGSV